jgi:hypothetical protein
MRSVLVAGHRPRAISAVAVVLLASGASFGARNGITSTSSSTGMGGRAAPATGWPLPGQNYDNARAAAALHAAMFEWRGTQ